MSVGSVNFANSVLQSLTLNTISQRIAAPTRPTNQNAPAVILDLTETGAQRVAQSDAPPTGVFQDADLFRNAFSDLNPYLENLTEIRLSPNLSRAEAAEISDRINSREFLAFGRFAATSTLDFALGYLAYYDSLSPEERNSHPYAGSREQVAAIARRAAAEEGRVIRDPDQTQAPLLVLFETIEAAAFKIDETTVEGVIDRFRAEAATLFNAEVDSGFVETAVERLRRIASLVTAAQGGDAAALSELNALGAAGATVSTTA